MPAPKNTPDPAVSASDGPTATPEELARAIAEQDPTRRLGAPESSPAPAEPTGALPEPASPPAGATEPVDEVEKMRTNTKTKVATAADLVVKDLPRGYTELVEWQPRTGTWAAGYVRRNESEAVYLGDDFRSEEEARRAVRNEASNDDAF